MYHNVEIHACSFDNFKKSWSAGLSVATQTNFCVLHNESTHLSYKVAEVFATFLKRAKCQGTNRQAADS